MNKLTSIRYTVVKTGFSLLFVSLLAFCSSLVSAQPGEFFGHIDELNEANGYLVINNEKIPFDRTRITLHYGGEVVDKYHLIPGIRIRYNRYSDGYLKDIHMLSPRNILEIMFKL